MEQPRHAKPAPNGGQFAKKINPKGDQELIAEPEHPLPIAVLGPSPMLSKVYEAATQLQKLVPDAVLVGGSAVAFYAGHRESDDHDHVVSDLADHYEMVLEAVESQDGWITNRLVPNKLILGRIGDIEVGVRQLIRNIPLEVAEYQLPSGGILRVPTPEETLRIKAYLLVVRNQTRDYLDVAALSDWGGIKWAAVTLADIGRFYSAQQEEGVSSQLARQLADPCPKDAKTTRHLAQYKRLQRRWQDWEEVRSVCASVAISMLDGEL